MDEVGCAAYGSLIDLWADWVHLSFTCDHLMQDHITTRHVSSELQLADIFIKSPGGSLQYKFNADILRFLENPCRVSRFSLDGTSYRHANSGRQIELCIPFRTEQHVKGLRRTRLGSRIIPMGHHRWYKQVTHWSKKRKRRKKTR